MNKLFLYRLLKHSPIAFAILLLFLICYSVVFYKKMDMVFFPHNSMYAISGSKITTASTYAVKLNGVRIRITNNLYWKKDFLETSLFGYCKYMENDHKVFLDNFISQRLKNESRKMMLLNRLTPDKEKAMNWPAWYIQFAGYKISPGSTIELMKYNFNFENEQAVLTDSISIYKTSLP